MQSTLRLKMNMKKILTTIIAFTFIIQNAGISYALRPMAKALVQDTLLSTKKSVTGDQESWKKILQDRIQDAWSGGLNLFPCVNEKFASYSLSQNVMTLFDLEDPLAPSRKAEGRHFLVTKFSDPDFLATLDESGRSLWIRINDVRSRHAARDLLEVISHPAIGCRIDGIMLPKVETVEDVRIVQSILKTIQRKRVAERCNGWYPGKLRIIVPIESASALENIDEIARQPAVVCLIPGTVDFKYSLGAWDQHHQFADLLYEKEKVLIAAKANRILPVESVTASLAYGRALEESRKAIHMGFSSKASVYPAHIEAMRDAGEEMGGWPKTPFTLKDYDEDTDVEEYDWDELVRKARAYEPLLTEPDRDSPRREKCGVQGIVWRVSADWKDLDIIRTARVDTVHLVLRNFDDINKARVLVQALKDNPYIQQLALDITMPRILAGQRVLLTAILDNIKHFDTLVLRGSHLNSEAIRRISEFLGEQEATRAPLTGHPILLEIAVTGEAQYNNLYKIIQQNPRITGVINDYTPVYDPVELHDKFFASDNPEYRPTIKMGRILNAAQAALVNAIQGKTGKNPIAREALIAAKNGYRGFVITDPNDAMGVRNALQPSKALIAEAIEVVKGLHMAEGRYIISDNSSPVERHTEIKPGIYEKHADEVVGAIKVISSEFFYETGRSPEYVLADKATQLLMARVLNRARELHRRQVQIGEEGFLSLAQLRDIELYANPKISTDGLGIDFTLYEPIWYDASADSFCQIRNRVTGAIYTAINSGLYPIPAQATPGEGLLIPSASAFNPSLQQQKISVTILTTA